MTLYIQYQKSKNLSKLITELKPVLSINERAFFTDFFNIQTAKGAGLDNWGIILNQSRGIQVDSSSQITLGFYDGKAPYVTPPKNFNHGVFYAKRIPGLLSLSDDAYRHLLLLVYAGQTTNNSIGSANKIMNYYYQSNDPAKRVIVRENILEQMSIQYLFNFKLEPYETAIYSMSGVLPRPAGVSISILDKQVF